VFGITEIPKTLAGVRSFGRVSEVFGNQTDCTWPPCIRWKTREWTWDGVVVAAASSERGLAALLDCSMDWAAVADVLPASGCMGLFVFTNTKVCLF
jgi:hypothetical protein